jgi:hypothetical protein
MAVIMRNEVAQKNYYFDEMPFLRAAEDYVLWLTIARNETIVGIPEPLAVYCLHTTNISQDIAKTLKQWKFILHKFGPYVPIHVYCRKICSFYWKISVLTVRAVIYRFSRWCQKNETP